ncbi:hypothetical protein SGCZBJ_25020 [Caulobacter zeae]|uniref:Uncharacterized protein n=1 Tax=Caulobacter zeae TaxID=2055137 RepID=A0A2N5CYK9_9CAUL|nr:hypothetical protein SGCZBJ_25020 [Caulobacter zeae]
MVDPWNGGAEILVLRQAQEEDFYCAAGNSPHPELVEGRGRALCRSQPRRLLRATAIAQAPAPTPCSRRSDRGPRWSRRSGRSRPPGPRR